MQCEQNQNVSCIENRNFKLNLYLNNDAMELCGDFVPNVIGKAITVEALCTLLNGLRLQGCMDIKNLQQFCIAASEGKAIKSMVLMRGHEPVAGTDGYLNIINSSQKHSKVRLDSATNVMTGQTVASVVPPTPGVGGVALDGKVIPARAGVAVKIRLGKGVRWAEDTVSESIGGDIVALVDGRVMFDAANKIISVQDTLVVDENVDLKYGNIDFIGTVEIHGDVENGHAIKAGKAIRIKGNVESAFLEAGGDIEIGGGVAGKEKGLIKSGGNISMRYLDCCNVECKGNLVVRNEIVDCVVMAGGHVDVSNGSIIGGRIMAAGGIEAKILGSEIGVPTVLISGRHYIAEREIVVLNGESKEITARLEAISRKLDPYVRNAKPLNRMTDRERAELQQLTGEFTRLNIRLKKIPEEIELIRDNIKKRTNPMVNAGRMIAKGVEVNIGSASIVISDPIRKAISVVKNSMSDGVRIINRIKLSDNAAKAEREIAKIEMSRT